MIESQLRTPIVFIIFNRPETTATVFAEIAAARPQKLLVVADGPRRDKPGEVEKCELTRKVIENIDWDCEIIKDFSDTNLGCKRRVSSGLDWAFQQVEEAIVIEDDCLPDPSFFRFCEEMLERHRHDQRVGSVSGNNFQFGHQRCASSYYFSKYTHIWGWATWRDRWLNSYDASISKWPRVREERWLDHIVGNADEAVYWANIFEQVFLGNIDTWDYQWLFANWLEGRLTVLPSVNLISNIGFGPNATHTSKVNELANMARHPISFPLLHPPGVFRSIQSDNITDKRCFRIPLYRRIVTQIFNSFCL